MFMGRSVEAFSAIASDIGVRRFADEEEDSFCCRVAYSAARFWLSAFCMDDGAVGEEGLTKQAMNRRLKTWVSNLDDVRPGIGAWFDDGGKGLSTIYNRLIDVGDLAPKGFSGSFVATRPVKVDLSSRMSCIVGFYDPTIAGANICGHDVRSMVNSGLLSLVHSENALTPRPTPWWVRDCDYMTWEKTSNYNEVKFADVRTMRWNINRPDIWSNAPTWVNDLALARVDGGLAGPLFFVAVKGHGRVRMSQTTRNQAQELFFYLRCESGHQAVARYTMLDNFHAQAVLPVGFLPGGDNRVIDAVGWPVEGSADRSNRIIRTETIPLLEEVLSENYIGFRGATNERK